MKLQQYQLAMGGLFSALLLAGCQSTKIEDAPSIIANDQYLINIPDADIRPTKEQIASQSTKKVVVLPVQFKSDSASDKSAVREMSAMIEAGLNAAGATTVDRSLAGKLADEIMAYEATGRFGGSGVDVADYAILPKVNNVVVTSSFTPQRTYKDDGETKVIPSSCKYSGEVSGGVTVYKLPNLKSMKAVSINGSFSDTDQSMDRRCTLQPGQSAQLASLATKDGVEDVLHQVQTIFKQQGFVIEYRRRDDTHLVQISLGSNQGIAEGQEIEFFTKIKRTDRLTGKETISVLPYEFKGKVSELVEPNRAWVLVDKQAEKKLKFGDIAEQYFKPLSATDKIWNSFKNAVKY
ncbi:hypothetical protein [Neptunicella marina]|uniref:Curli production assembly/transport component CsgG n=1 Tax=Neptunicella marina TaxID=2125989 RepID=A0A8J6M2W6_9ALTE|nr:hypothetical protein [Neptunicella marina]MBC3766582.1 hypothetical protein [Neptunicella marina]